MKQLLLPFLWFIISFHAGNTMADTFDPTTNVVTIDSVTVTGDRTYFQYGNTH